MGAQTVHIVGGGLVGSLLSIFLAKKGFQVELYEGRSDMRKEEIDAGRSINLVITSRGLQALEQVGLREQALDIAVPVKGRMLHDVQGQTTFVPYGQRDNEVINAISRGLLNCLLLDAAEQQPSVNIHFGQRCTDYDIENKTLTFNDQTTVSADIVIGTDGAFSAIRRVMLDQVMNFDYAQSFLDSGYKELIIPATANGGYQIDQDALHIWPRGHYMLMALGNMDGSFTCTLFFPYQGEQSFAALKTEQDVIAFFEQNFPDAIALMPTLAEDFAHNPVGSLVTVKCNPWHVGGQTLLIGDAAHALVPFFGQGMNSGFEDCFVLDQLITGTDIDWETVFQQFNQQRKPNTDAIADMAVENYLEMRDTTADPVFQLKKQVGFELEKRYPERFIPRYSMVMFHPEISYAEAKRRSEIQAEILSELCANITAPEQINWGQAKRLLTSKFNDHTSAV